MTHRSVVGMNQKSKVIPLTKISFLTLIGSLTLVRTCDLIISLACESNFLQRLSFGVIISTCSF